ncbi:MAG TPA: trigger factor family protein, partial [Candidatus Limnocylindria bacterium]|nr:trigger factor family protein [Candidatus Limnocylindria bacterium]
MEAETCKKELVIEIPVDVIRKEADTVTAQYTRVARIPGFRPGHAPASIVRNRFREDIKGEVVQTL